MNQFSAFRPKKALATAFHLFVGVPQMLCGIAKDFIASKQETDNRIVSDLREKGIHIFEHDLTSDEISDLSNDFTKLQNEQSLDSDGQLKGRIFSHGILSQTLGQHAEKIKPLAMQFLNSKHVGIEISYYQESFPVETTDDIPGGEFHVDDNKANLKYFIYLTKVSDENGPFSCVPGTGGWKFRNSFLRGILWEITHKRKYLYEYGIEPEKLVTMESKITGPIGTHFLVDTTSLHRALPVINGSRKVAVISFNR